MKPKNLVFLILAVFLFTSTIFVSAQEQEYNPPTVLVLGWDGFDYRSAEQLINAGQLPNLSKLYLVKFLAWPTNSATKVGWSEIETGLGGDTTNIRTNANFNSKILPEWTIYGIIRQNCPECWLSTIHSKRDHTGDQLNGKKALTFYRLKPWALAGGMDRYISCSVVGSLVDMPIEQTRSYLLNHIAAFKSSGKKGGLIFAHFEDPDHAGHSWGMGSSGWNNYLIKLDLILGEAINLLQPDVVFVVSDHGFNTWGSHYHSNAPLGILASNIPVKSGLRVDFPSTLVEVFGIPTEGRDPSLLGKSLIIR